MIRRPRLSGPRKKTLRVSNITALGGDPLWGPGWRFVWLRFSVRLMLLFLAPERPDYHGAQPQLPVLGSGQMDAGKLSAGGHEYYAMIGERARGELRCSAEGQDSILLLSPLSTVVLRSGLYHEAVPADSAIATVTTDVQRPRRRPAGSRFLESSPSSPDASSLSRG